MALYLNLYHEIQKQKLKRQRDPFKIGIMVLLLIAVGFIAYYFWRLEAVQQAKHELLRVDSEWKAAEPKEKVALVRRDELEANGKIRDTVVHRIENRFYWAPLVEHLLHVAPPEIQITNFGGTVVNNGAKKVSITVTGISTGGQPRTVAENFRKALESELKLNYQQVSSAFVSLEDSPETVQYQGKNQATANFVISLGFVSPDIDDTEKSGSKTPTRAPKS